MNPIKFLSGLIGLFFPSKLNISAGDCFMDASGKTVIIMFDCGGKYPWAAKYDELTWNFYSSRGKSYNGNSKDRLVSKLELIVNLKDKEEEVMQIVNKPLHLNVGKIYLDANKNRIKIVHYYKPPRNIFIGIYLDFKQPQCESFRADGEADIGLVCSIVSEYNPEKEQYDKDLAWLKSLKQDDKITIFDGVNVNTSHFSNFSSCGMLLYFAGGKTSWTSNGISLGVETDYIRTLDGRFINLSDFKSNLKE